MKNISTVILTAALIMTSCSSDNKSHELPVYDIEKAYKSEPFTDLTMTDVVYVPLDPNSSAMFSERASIKGVLGDTLIIMDNDDQYRILLFSLTDGRLLGTLSHQGEGPGEYRWIDNVYVDRPGALVINTPDNVAYRYTTDDVLTDTYKYSTRSNYNLSNGSLEKGICLYEQNDSGFVVHRLDRNFVQTDSVKVDGYKLGYLSGMFSTFDNECIVSMADTVYAVRPGGLEKIMVLNRGERIITPEIETELHNIKRSGNFAQAMEKQAQYIHFGFLMTDGRYLELISFGNGESFIDIFRMNDGTHMAHMPISDDTSGFDSEYKGAAMHLRPQYVDTDGRWYAIISESESVGADGSPNDGSLNVGVVSFRFGE